MYRLVSQILRKNFAEQFKPKEIIDSYWQVEQKIQQLSLLLQSSKYPIVFTGAGISTSLGIPDYRSGAETIINTGPGMWNRNHLQAQNPHQTPIDKLVDLAKPSLSHMFISTALKQGIIKHLISQNTDGLHLKSGVSIQNISELHGNRNLQFCVGCHRKYSRDFRTLKRDGKKYYPGQKRDHQTGRLCQNCGAGLHDSIIYFGQKLPQSQLESAYLHASQSDLCICIGSSLTVKPSANIPLYVAKKKEGGKLCIINIQQTPIDPAASLRINYFCDDVLELLSQRIGMKIDKLTVQHFIKISLSRNIEYTSFVIEGKDKSGNNLSFIKSIHIILSNKKLQSESIGHQCIFSISNNEILQIKSIIIFHFGEKQPFQINQFQLNVLQSQITMMSYKIQEGCSKWKMEILS